MQTQTQTRDPAMETVCSRLYEIDEYIRGMEDPIGPIEECALAHIRQQVDEGVVDGTALEAVQLIYERLMLDPEAFDDHLQSSWHE